MVLLIVHVLFCRQLQHRYCMLPEMLLAVCPCQRWIFQVFELGSSVLLPAANIDPRIAAPVQYPMASASVSAPVPVPVVQQAPQPSSMAFPSIQFQQPTSIAKHLVTSEPSLQSSPAIEEGEVPESEFDPDRDKQIKNMAWKRY
ncbi:Uncharacterized protein Rs2_37990 [Raphanus sativus]|nr:Uncharacterized protein Rs2_37990 [Raphanus sativus]